ncbi:unnamed protein product [Microthlaspi erraticum]|uniref:Uncharacterized protein n=1 Tax=Microthlaspi erraticum TaxID=1685480 RepID=A0A6D2IMP2_9BRAS|nr:unnamed protein product [Microthlaspi erraticum]
MEGKTRSWKNWLIPKRPNPKIHAVVCGGARKKARSKSLGHSDWRPYRSEMKRISTGKLRRRLRDYISPIHTVVCWCASLRWTERLEVIDFARLRWTERPETVWRY